MGLQIDLLLSRVVRQVKDLLWWPYSGLHGLWNVTVQRPRKALYAALLTTKPCTQDPVLCFVLMTVEHQNPSHL